MGVNLKGKNLNTSNNSYKLISILKFKYQFTNFDFYDSLEEINFHKFLEYGHAKLR